MTRKELESFLAPVTKRSAEYAKRLSLKHSSFNEIAEAEVYDLAETLDGDMQTAIYIKLSVALASRRVVDSFKFGRRHTEEELCSYLVAKSFGLSVETVHVISENDSGVALACDKVGEGTVNYSNVLPRKIIEIAKRHGAKKVIICHNHPGGYAGPSDDDISSTKLLFELLLSSGIKLSAHYVVAGDKCKKIDF